MSALAARRTPRSLLGLVVSVLLLAGLVVVAAPSRPVEAADAVSVAFLRSTDGGFSRHVYVSSSTGTEQRRLTPQRAEGRLSFSPDAQQVVFSGPPGNDDTFGRRALHVVDVDSGATRQLTNPGYADTDPDWSPDGGRFAFVRATNGRFTSPTCCALFVSDANGGGAAAVPGTTGAEDPAWSPDGSRIAYATPSGLFTIRPDGSDRRQIGSGELSAPSWAPDGSHIVAVQDQGLGQSRAIVFTSDGSAFSFPADPDGVTEDPRFTSDSRSVVFVRGSGAGVEGRFAGELHRVRVFDGGGVSQLFAPPTVPHHLDLAPAPPPVGRIDLVQLEGDGVRVRGWGLDPAVPAESTQVVVTVKGRETTVLADAPRSDVADDYPGAGEAHGVDQVFPADRPGPISVCVRVLSVDETRSTSLGCVIVGTRRVRYAPGS